MKRIIMHWTAGKRSVSKTDLRHYHEIVDGFGDRHIGDHKPEANLNLRSGQYAAHTRALNTGSVGLAMAAMYGAKQRPFKKGQYPIRTKQLNEFVRMCAEYCDTYNIPVTRRTVLSHAEVQPTLGVWQRGKWDVTWLPGMTRPDDPVKVGDMLRNMIRKELAKIQTHPETVDTVRGGRVPWWVRWLTGLKR